MRFEKVEKYKDIDLIMPKRATAGAAGYDMAAAEDYVIPSFWQMIAENNQDAEMCAKNVVSLSEMAAFTKENKFRPTLVSTGMKCKLDDGKYLKLVVRSSSPLKYWLCMANSEGIIDRDYYGNVENDGEIFFQLYNLSPYPISIKKGEILGQGIISSYYTTEDDAAKEVRVGGFGSTTAK